MAPREFFRDPIQSFAYKLDPQTGLIDYDDMERLALEHQPKMSSAADLLFPRMGLQTHA
jgi:glycine/serine hydroxymethyltransferase